MSNLYSPRVIDLVVSLVLLAGGIWGLIEMLGLPYRAALWPSSVFILFIGFTLIHLVQLLRGWSDTGEDADSGE